MLIHAMIAHAAIPFAVAAAPPAAQDGPSASMVQALEKCLTINADAERLACMDTAARTLVAATKTREVVLVDREEMKKTRRSLFGFALPRMNLFGGRDGPDQDREEVQQIETVIKQVGRAAYGRYILTTEDGARWTTTQDWSGLELPQVGRPVTIKRGVLGSYWVTVQGGRAIKAMRIG